MTEGFIAAIAAGLVEDIDTMALNRLEYIRYRQAIRDELRSHHLHMKCSNNFYVARLKSQRVNGVRRWRRMFDAHGLQAFCVKALQWIEDNTQRGNDADRTT